MKIFETFCSVAVELMTIVSIVSIIFLKQKFFVTLEDVFSDADAGIMNCDVSQGSLRTASLPNIYTYMLVIPASFIKIRM